MLLRQVGFEIEHGANARVLPPCHHRQPFRAETLASYLLRQRQQDIDSRIERSSGKLAFDVAPFRPDV